MLDFRPDFLQAISGLSPTISVILTLPCYKYTLTSYLTVTIILQRCTKILRQAKRKQQKKGGGGVPLQAPIVSPVLGCHSQRTPFWSPLTTMAASGDQLTHCTQFLCACRQNATDLLTPSMRTDCNFVLQHGFGWFVAGCSVLWVCTAILLCSRHCGVQQREEMLGLLCSSMG